MTDEQDVHSHSHQEMNRFYKMLPIWVGLLAVLLTLSSLWTGLLLDDYQMLVKARGGYETAPTLTALPIDLFLFLDGNPHLSLS